MAGVPYVSSATLGECTARWLAAVAPWSRARPLPALDHAALLVLDMQRYFAEPSSHAYLPALAAVLPNAVRLAEAFRDAGRPVVLTRHGAEDGHDPAMMGRWWRDQLRRGEERAALVATLADWPADRVLDKAHYSAFQDTDLQGWLARRGCDAVVVAGVMTHLCCETTVRAAFMLGLAPVLVADACASQDEELHLGALRGLAHGFAVVTDTDTVLGALTPSAPRTSPTRRPALPTTVPLAVVGAGPAGLAAAIQAARAGVELCLLDPCGHDGAQARTASWIENYPGFPGGIDGARLMDRFVAQAREHGLEPVRERVAAVRGPGEPGGALTLELASGQRLLARAVIVATGAVPRPLQLELPEGAPVVHRADALARVRGQRLLVVGGGEAALDQALRLRRLGAARVDVAFRTAAPRAMDLLVRRAIEQGITLRPRTRLARLGKGSDGWVAGLDGDDPLALDVDAVVVCVGKLGAGPEPRLPGEASAADRLGRTPLPGLYRVGDCCRGRYRQVAVAVGDGVAAAMHATSYLQNGQWEEPT